MNRVFSKLMSEIQSGKFVYTGEISPGKTTRIEGLIRSAGVLGKHVTACNVTDNPRARANMSSLAASIAIQEKAGVEVICQMTARDRNRIALTSDLLGAAALGVRNVLVMSGDHPSLGDNPLAMPVYDLDSAHMVELVRRMVDEGTDLVGNRIDGEVRLHVGVVGNPNADPIEVEIAKLERKAEIGAEFIQTQAVFDIEVAERFLDSVEGIGVPVLIGIMPCRSFRTAEQIEKNVPGIRIPQEYLERLRGAEELPDLASKEERADFINEEYFSSMISDLRRTGRLAGAHIMGVSYNQIVGRIVEAVQKREGGKRSKRKG
ncbi:MAG: methylenetetrahydrofolate reductase [Candidatus Methanosuratus sp.]|nr:methylenetetrahydrofolate reductase [Candidatus Methanosuratincola sp.]